MLTTPSQLRSSGEAEGEAGRGGPRKKNRGKTRTIMHFASPILWLLTLLLLAPMIGYYVWPNAAGRGRDPAFRNRRRRCRPEPCVTTCATCRSRCVRQRRGGASWDVDRRSHQHRGISTNSGHRRLEAHFQTDRIGDTAPGRRWRSFIDLTATACRSGRRSPRQPS